MNEQWHNDKAIESIMKCIISYILPDNLFCAIFFITSYT